MPTYQYACTNPDGKHQFEVVQSFTDAPVGECPECGSAVRKVYGSVGVVFKGSGFYRTDSRAPSGSGAKDGGTKDGGAKDGKKDAAPAAAGTSSSGTSSSGTSSSGGSSSGSSGTSSSSGAAAG